MAEGGAPPEERSPPLHHLFCSRAGKTHRMQDGLGTADAITDR